MGARAHIRVGIAVAMFLHVAPSARAQPVDFASCPAQLTACDGDTRRCCTRELAAGAVVIPLDRCHQKLADGGSFAPADASAPAWCVDPSPVADDGMFEAYGLVVRLMQAGIPVYWLVNPTKAPPASSERAPNDDIAGDVDAWVLGAGIAEPPDADQPLSPCGAGCTAPVARLRASDLREAARYSARELPMRGGVFAIAPEDRARFDDFWLARGDFAARSGDARFDFSAVDLYELQPGARVVYTDHRSGRAVTGAPVAVTIDYPAPRLARLAPAGVAARWLARAKLDDPADYPGCLTGAFAPPSALYCDVSETDIQAGYLVQGELDAAWIDGWSASAPCADSAGRLLRKALGEFLTAVPGVRAGGHVLVKEAAAGGGQGCRGRALVAEPGDGSEPADATARTLLPRRNAANLLLQMGDLPTTLAQGALSYARFRGEPANGLAVYMVGNTDDEPGAAAHLRMLLNALIALPTATVPQRVTENVLEVSRSAPVVAVVERQRTHYQGSYEVLDPEPPVTVFAGVGSAATFEFPHVTGHLRAYDAGRVGDATTAFGDVGGVVFDAAHELPPANAAGCAEHFTAACRTVFTTVREPAGPSRRVYFERAAAPTLRSALGPELAVSEIELLIARVLAGHQRDGVQVSRLGGVDRSTMAVVEASALAADARPTMIYVGALDGMLHAFCAERGGPCQRPGQELWAFVPSNQLPLLRHNRQRIDGSPRVIDVYADPDGDGTSTWRTVLAFQTGGRAPGVYALDVTDPADPRALWELTELGVGLGLAMAPVKVGAEVRDLTFALTNERASGRRGFQLAAIDTVSGEIVWRFARDYPAPRDAEHPPVPVTGIPGGASTVDLTRTGFVTHVLAPTLYGDIWLLEAAAGVNPYGERPLFRFGSDFHPIGAPLALYRARQGGALHAVAGSGGYADPVNTSWSPDDVEQYLLSIELPATAEAAPLSEADASFAIPLGAGQRVFAQPTVAGHELFAVVDTSDVNLDTYGTVGDVGALQRLGLSDGRRVGGPISIAGGASSVDATASGVVHQGGGAGVRRVDFSATFDPDGETTELIFAPRTGREVWLRLR